MERNKNCILGGSREDLVKFCLEKKIPKFRARQIMDWIYKKFERDFCRMNNLPLNLRQDFADEYQQSFVQIESEHIAKDGTNKLLLKLTDGECIEMVIIPGEERITFCLSTQVGCPVGCLFCASGKNGLVRNLSTAEMLDEFQLGCHKIGRLPDNVVFMGIGEGLLNFESLKKTLEFISEPEYFGLGVRRITVSTSGYVPGIYKLADLKKEFNLAISLHAPTDEIRSKIIPDKLRYNIAEIMLAADYYLEQCGRMVTFEYTLLDSVNDNTDSAKKLAELAKAHHAKINLIPYNETGSAFKRPSSEKIRRFFDTLEREKAHVTIRQERGNDAAGACGQLRLHKIEK